MVAAAALQAPRNERLIRHNGEARSIAAWHRTGAAVPYNTFWRRIDSGWTVGRALSELPYDEQARLLRQQERARKSRRAMRALWDATGTLYTENNDVRMASGILDELIETFGPIANDTAAPETVDWDYEDDSHAGTQRVVDLRVMSPPIVGHAYECTDCAALFSDGFACFGCDRATCKACVDRQDHKCRPESMYGGASLEEIGESLGGISRERVRQIEAGALNRMREELLRMVPLQARKCGPKTEGFGAY